MKTLLIGFIIIITLSCNEKNEKNKMYNSVINVNSINNVSTSTEKIENNTIENISYYIFSDLKLEWVYSNLNDLFTVLKFENNYSIKKRIEKNTMQTAEGFYYVYDIECNQYKIIASSFSLKEYSMEEFENMEFNEYQLESIEIELNENYLILFPYSKIEDFMKDDNFGNICIIEKDEIFYAMRYGEDDRFGYSDLLFNNGILKSICIRAYHT